jgi:hypothetical protein
MPTDLDAVSRRKRAQADETQTAITMISICLIIYLGALVLLLKVFGA